VTRFRDLLVTDLAPGVLFLFAILCFAPRLSVPQQYVFDEVYHAYTAGQYVAGNADAYVWSTHAPKEGVAYMWNHPPLGILLIAGGIEIFGDDSFGWRFSAVIFGAAGIVLAWFLTLRVTKDRMVALLVAGLLLCEGLYFAQARVGMLDVFGTFFSTAALLSLYRFLTEEQRVPWAIVRTGLWLGLALATKWNAAYLALFCGLVVVWKVLRVPRLWGWVVLGLGVVPFAVYLAAYVPFFYVGHTASEWVELQKQIYMYHTRLTATHPWSSSWWQWPLALRPVWYWTSTLADGRVENGFAAQNILLTWSFLPAVCWLAYRWRRSSAELTVLLIGFFGQWLPWALVPRIAFTYHFLPAVPFGVLAVAMAVAAAHRAGGWARKLAWIYVALVVATFLFYYPILTGIPMSRDALAWRLWLPGWVPR
jgi:dolichyl-phosphate-mannose--protein O-mannosyl transferase